jgi:hypothetical protein
MDTGGLLAICFIDGERMKWIKNLFQKKPKEITYPIFDLTFIDGKKGTLVSRDSRHPEEGVTVFAINKEGFLGMVTYKNGQWIMLFNSKEMTNHFYWIDLHKE